MWRSRREVVREGEMREVGELEVSKRDGERGKEGRRVGAARVLGTGCGALPNAEVLRRKLVMAFLHLNVRDSNPVAPVRTTGFGPSFCHVHWRLYLATIMQHIGQSAASSSQIIPIQQIMKKPKLLSACQSFHVR